MHITHRVNPVSKVSLNFNAAFYVTYRYVCEIYLARVLTFVRSISLFRRLETVELTKRSLLGDMAVSNNNNKIFHREVHMRSAGHICLNSCSLYLAIKASYLFII